QFYFSRFGGCDFNFDNSLSDFMNGYDRQYIRCDNGFSYRSNNNFYRFERMSFTVHHCTGGHLSQPYCSSSVPFCELDSTKESMKQMESECER
ncbi:hypothetical protein, partial [Photobacterium damselae]